MLITVGPKCVMSRFGFADGDGISASIAKALPGFHSSHLNSSPSSLHSPLLFLPSSTMFPSPAQPTMQDPPKPTTKPPVIRGARACTVCRAAKMKCVGGEEGVKPCQRCKRTGVDCIFEKHRRGRKPGSKLSEASRVLRHLEKGLSDAKAKSQQAASSQVPRPDAQSAIERFPNNELPPLNIPPDHESGPSRSSHTGHSHPMEVDDNQEDESAKRGEGLYPAQLIRKAQSERSTFFKTILNPEPTNASTRSNADSSSAPPRSSSPAIPPTLTIPPLDNSELKDPITAGVIDESRATVLFELFFLRLNPFINLFDPALHTVQYVRSRCPFLFSTMIMACCKFFQPDLYDRILQIAQAYALRAFAENWKRIEVVQAFACLTYWKEPHDTRTWTYIGYSGRMAVELGLNRFVGKRAPEETELQFRERRNRERTYLVLFVHDRSLSTQTGRQWMLPEDELVRRSSTWHGEGSTPVRAEDVIVASFVQLQHISSETTESFRRHRDAPVNHDMLLRSCNGKLTQWMDTWQHEMRRANGESFHFCFLNIFRLHVRLFLNSFGVQASMAPNSRSSPNMQALSACFSSALEILQIITQDFAAMGMLRYAQDSVTVMTAYASIFLLMLLRSSNTAAALHEGASEEIYKTISLVSEAYRALSTVSAAHHARFLRNLVELDIHRAKQAEQERRLHEASGLISSHG